MEESMRIEFLNVPVDLVSLDDSVERACEAMRYKTPRIQQVSLNVAKLVKAQDDPQLKADIVDSNLIGIDGIGILWGLKLAGFTPKGRVNGTDLMMRLLEACARYGFHPYFLGATQEVAEGAAENARALYPGLEFAGIHNGYFTEADEESIVAAIRESGAHCLFVGMPTPRKERFLLRNRDALSVPFIMGVGGSLDVLAGKVNRAPVWMQRNGLEWLYRIIQEPGRMWWRYVSTNAVYARMLLGVLGRRIFQRSGHGSADGGVEAPHPGE
jgi:N-acetylglucosaminyldiphosphoundecaprenol N-acetyl-beta-D-mannosaminyltransferase